MLTRAFCMIHHSATQDSRTLSWPAIRRFHLEKGWHDIGYHAGVELVNDHLEALFGRPETEPAAACRAGNMNELALHLCIVGNFDVVEPSDTLLGFAAKYVIRPWLVRYRMTAENVIGHRDAAPDRTCPGRLFDLDRLRGMV